MIAVAYFIYYFCVYMCLCVDMWMSVYVLTSMDICVETTGPPWVMILEMFFWFWRQFLTGARDFVRLDWLVSDMQRSGVSICRAWGLAFYMGAGVQTQILMLFGQVFHWLIYLPSPSSVNFTVPQHEPRVLHVLSSILPLTYTLALPLFCICMWYCSASNIISEVVHFTYIF